jgi:two-component system, cell cycle response regulator
MRRATPLPSRALLSATILVVEDDDSSRVGLAKLLGGCGYHVITAVDAEAALRHVDDTHIEIVLADVNLPGVDGFELTKRLRQGRNREVPILLMSAEASSSRKVTGLDLGADDFVQKPIDFDELLARIRAHLRRGTRQRELEDKSKHDALTGTLNRGAIEEELARQIKLANRSGLPVSVLMADVDDFKDINDRHGHAAGDDALCDVAKTLVKLVRSTDRVGRIGGDEFLVVLPNTNHLAATQLVRRLRSVWRQAPPRVHRTDRRIYISVGVATSAPGDSLEALVRRADVMMYDDKRRSRRALP